MITGGTGRLENATGTIQADAYVTMPDDPYALEWSVTWILDGTVNYWKIKGEVCSTASGVIEIFSADSIYEKAALRGGFFITWKCRQMLTLC